jgi:RNA polymerase sigma-70 factor (ECF subfamily)
VDHYRRRRPQEELSDALSAAPVEEDEERARNEMGRCLLPMMNNLPASSREALVLYEIKGRSQQEVAALQGLSLSGAKSRIQRSRALLRDQILECCKVEFDGRGRVIDYERRGGGVCGRGECGPCER